MEMRYEVLSKVGAQDMNTSGYQVSDLEDVEFYWDICQLHVDVVFKTGIATRFSAWIFIDFEMGSIADNPSLIDEEQHKGNFPPLPSTPVSERPT